MDVEQSVQKLMLASALVDYFDPITFGQKIIDGDARNSALSTLSYSCDEITEGEQYYWSLKPDKRRELLVSHFDQAIVEELISQIEVVKDDAFARYLHLGLRGEDLKDQAHETDTRQALRNEAALEDEHALLRAARLIDLLDIKPKTIATNNSEKHAGEATTAGSARFIRQSIARRAAMEALDNTAGGDLYGRYREFRELIKYRNSNLADTKNRALKLFIIIGVGGVGKSALVSRFIAWQRQRSSQPPVVHFDFDRASLKPEEPISLTLEFTRQLGLFDSSIDRSMSGYRSRYRKSLGSLDKETSNHQQLNDLGRVLENWPHKNRAVLLVIDTFEEVAIRGTQAVENTLSWISELRDRTGLENLHVVISGREMPDCLLSDHGIHVRHRIRLNDLHASAAQLLLQSVNIDNVVAEQAVDTFGSNPLVLRMFIRFFERNPDEVHALLKDGQHRKRSAPAGNLAVTFLFERILVRISDSRIQKLTSPGLLLRHITAELIEKVLAEPCGLGQLSCDDAQSLFDSLASHVWLVRQEGDRLLSHRRDLRRLMLPGIRQHDVKRFYEINKRAVAYYQSNPPGVTAKVAKLEAAYHQGFLPDAPTYSNKYEARQIITQLGADLLDWPVQASALIKHQAQLPERLTIEEKNTLEQSHDLTSRALRVQELHESTTEATQTAVDNQFQSDSATDQAQEVLGKQELNRLATSIRSTFDDGRFERISEIATDALRPLFRRREALATTHYWQDHELLVRTPWLVALSVLAEPDADQEPQNIIPVNLLDAVQATPRRVGMELTFELFYMLAIANLMNDRRALDSLSSFLHSSLPCFTPPIRHLAQLQIVQLSIKAFSKEALIGRRDVISILDTSLLRFNTLSMDISEEHPDTLCNRKRLEAISLFTSKLNGKQPTLNELRQFQSNLREHKVEVLGPAGLDLLNSVQRSLHRPAVFALESLPALHIYRALYAIAGSSDLWPAEFSPATIDTRPAPVYDRTNLMAIVDFADRCGLLPTLLQEVNKSRHDPLLLDLHRLLVRLEQRLTGDYSVSTFE